MTSKEEEKVAPKEEEKASVETENGNKENKITPNVTSSEGGSSEISSEQRIQLLERKIDLLTEALSSMAQASQQQIQQAPGNNMGALAQILPQILPMLMEQPNQQSAVIDQFTLANRYLDIVDNVFKGVVKKAANINLD